MKIGELSSRTGVSHRMLRYYEQQGLLDTRRSSNGYRHYGQDAPVTVAQIRGLLAAGIPTDVIRDILPCAQGATPTLTPCPDLIATLRTQLAEQQSRIDCLQQNRDALRRYLDTATHDASSRTQAPYPAPD
jgi:DNA-binding transcriptional MerR regulator